jgi:hypothetical protein
LEDGMATARLTALGSMLAAAALVGFQEATPNAGMVTLVGIAGLVMLGLGLVMGYRGSITAAAVAFVARLAIMTPFGLGLTLPLWAHGLLIVLMVELGSLSFSARNRPIDPVRSVSRCTIVALGSAGAVEMLRLLVEGSVVSGSLVRVAGVAAAVIAAGWVARLWWRSGLSG